VKRWGKSPPLQAQARRQGKPHREQDQIGNLRSGPLQAQSRTCVPPVVASRRDPAGQYRLGRGGTPVLLCEPGSGYWSPRQMILSSAGAHARQSRQNSAYSPSGVRGSWPPLPMNRGRVGQTFLSAGWGDFPVARSTAGLESPANWQAGKPALRPGSWSQSAMLESWHLPRSRSKPVRCGSAMRVGAHVGLRSGLRRSSSELT
jgi:hypothetical protein